MSDIKYKTQLLAAIDHLRSRKSRPDINRICKFMLKRYKVSTKETKADLKRCLKDRSIYKVDYKDNVSYRNAANWRKKSKHNIDMSLTVAKERRIITSAIATLIYQDQTYLENGIPFDDLIKTAAAQDSKHTKKQLENIVNKELLTGSLVKLPNGNLALGPADHDGDSSDSFKFDYTINSNTKMTSSANSSRISSPQRTRGRPRKHSINSNDYTTKNASQSNSAVRVGERRKMAKKVFDPSDNVVPNKKKRGRPLGSLNKRTIKKRLTSTSNQENSEKGNTPLSDSQSFDGSGDEIEQDEMSRDSTGPICSVCLNQRTKSNSDKLVECSDCNNKAHFNCIQSGSGILKMRPDNTWQCPHCKTCIICCETSDAGVLTVCSICSDAYHALCHSPRIPERLKGWDQWECSTCLGSSMTTEKPVHANRNNELKNSHKEDPFLKQHEIDRAPSKLQREIPVDSNIPDITNWTVADVYDYFKEHLPEAAPVLKEQEFDGQVLREACRADIVKGLGLPLGPALALYRIIVKLQTRKDDWTMCWG